jgi:hypothetical protein
MYQGLHSWGWRRVCAFALTHRGDSIVLDSFIFTAVDADIALPGSAVLPGFFLPVISQRM